ncbi:MAG: hypothetical protein R3E89_18000 [Thiolinea sp.]
MADLQLEPLDGDSLQQLSFSLRPVLCPVLLEQLGDFADPQSITG